jgi:alanine racemase
VLAGAGAEWLGVTGVEEGRVVRRFLREAGIEVGKQPRVLVMCGISAEDAEAVVAEGLTPVVWSLEQVRWLAKAAERAGIVVPVHVEVDSGMTRQGVRPGVALRKLMKSIHAAKSLRLDGVMTHFASAEVAGSLQSIRQREMFEIALMEIGEAGVMPAWVSVGNTSGVDLVEGPEDLIAWSARLAKGIGARAMVRAGLGLYGYNLPLEPQAGSHTILSRLDKELKPVMTWKAKVIGVEDVSAGEAVGYNGTFVTERPMRLALVAAGYADGFRRELSSTNKRAGGWVMLRGKRAPVVGRVSMNLTSVDVTGIEGVVVGDDAVLLGEGVSAVDHAHLAGTIAYEILCGVRGDSC